MAPELTVAGDVRWETIDAATARRLGLETRTLGEAGRGTGRVQAQAVKVEDLWVEVLIDDDWLACYRFVVADDGTLHIGELRVLPRESAVRRPGTWSGTWQGMHATAPTKRLTSRHVHALRVALHADGFDQILSQLRADRQIPQTVLDRWGLTAPQPPAKTATRATDKRRKYSDLDYARIARDYQAASTRKGGRPIVAMAKQRGISPSTARGLVARAREAGMLSQGHQGQHGGVMTDRAEQLLASRQRKRKTKKR